MDISLRSREVIQVAYTQAAGGDTGTVSLAHIQASTSGLQLERSLLVTKQHKLQALIERQQSVEGQGSQSKPAAYMARSGMIAARAHHLQVRLLLVHPHQTTCGNST